MKKIVILIGILVSEFVFGMAGKAAEPISPVSVVTMQAVSKIIIEEKLGQNATNWNEIGADEGEAYFLDDGEKFYPGSRFIDDDRCFAVNSQGDIYLFDIVNNRIKKYDSEGKYLKSIPVKSWIGPVKYQPADKNYPAYTFVNPIEYIGRNITIDEDDNIYVYSWKNMQTNKNYKPSSSIISKYSPDDKLIRTWETNVMGEFKVDLAFSYITNSVSSNEFLIRIQLKDSKIIEKKFNKKDACFLLDIEVFYKVNEIQITLWNGTIRQYVNIYDLKGNLKQVLLCKDSAFPFCNNGLVYELKEKNGKIVIEKQNREIKK